MARTVGLSGGIGSGKSTASAIFAELGAAVIDADAIVHELQAPGTPLVDEIAQAFGRSLLGAGGVLDREALGSIVFRDSAARQRLNDLVHPRVGEEMARRVQSAHESGAALLILDIPLLFEGRHSGRGSRLAADTTILVWVPVEVQIERTVGRDGCSREEAERRIAAQMPIDEKKALADIVIDNSGSLDSTREQVERIYRELSSGAQG